MKRFLFNAAALVSLVLCLVAVALWMRSYWRWDRFALFIRKAGQPTTLYSSIYSVQSARGSIGVARGVEVIVSSGASAPGAGWKSEVNWHHDAGPLRLWTLPNGDTEPQRVFGLYDTSFAEWWHGFAVKNVAWGTPSNTVFKWTLGLAVPHWLVVLITGAWPVVRFGRALRMRNRLRQGYCPACGYDLRGTPGNTCPECGAESAMVKNCNA
jgi:hypothetical protein